MTAPTFSIYSKESKKVKPRFTNRNPPITSDMLIDAPLAVRQKMANNTIAPNLYEGLMEFEGTVLEVLTVDSEDSGFWQQLKEFAGYSLPEVPHYICRPDHILEHVPDPRKLTNAKEQFEWLKKHPVFEGLPSTGGENSKVNLINRGSRVRLKYSDATHRHGKVIELIHAHPDPESALLFGGAITPREIYEASDASSDVNKALRNFDPSKIDCDDLKPFTSINSGVRISETVAACMKYVIPFLPKGSVITSGVRKTEDQENIIRGYAGKEKKKHGSFPVSEEEMKTPAGLEKARVELWRRNFLIGQVRGDDYPTGDLPRAPDAFYPGHAGGKAFDISGAPLDAIDAAVRSIAAAAPGFVMTHSLIERANNCVHVQVLDSSYFDALDLQTAWYNITGCMNDPNPMVEHIVANYSMGTKTYATSDATMGISVEGRTPETSDPNSSAG
jgi:hypothetical protein